MIMYILTVAVVCVVHLKLSVCVVMPVTANGEQNSTVQCDIVLVLVLSMAQWCSG